MMEEATYSFGGAAKILDIAESKLRYWAQVGFVGPSARRGGKPMFSFQDLVSVKAAKELVDRGFKAAEIRKAIEGVRATLPHLDRPLDRIRVAFDGTRLVVVDDDTAFEPSGQRVFDFGLAELADKLGYTPPQNVTEARAPAAAVPLPEPPRPDKAKGKATFTPARSAYDWFVEGTRAEGADDDARRDLLPRGAGARSGAGGGAHEPGRARLPRAATPPPRATRSRRRWPSIPTSPRRASTSRTWCWRTATWSWRSPSSGACCRPIPSSPTRTSTWPSRSNAWAAAPRPAPTSNATSPSNPRPPAGPPRPAPSSIASRSRRRAGAAIRYPATR